MDPIVRLTARGQRWYRRGHPWVFREDVRAEDGIADGSVVRVLAADGKLLGRGFYNARSLVTLRFVTIRDEPIDARLWAERLDRAIAYRERVVGDSAAYRLLFGESDGFPGLVADVYDDVLVVQVLALGMELQLDAVLGLLLERRSFRGVLARNDLGARPLEGLPQEVRVLRGTVPEDLRVREHGLDLRIRTRAGQKTGAFLDQRENRLAARDYVGARVLDAFCYQGAFALHLARAGAETVVAVDSSAEALAVGGADARDNGLGQIRFAQANVFDFLRQAAQNEPRAYDLVLLDPPAFAKSRRDVRAARRAYTDINRRALQLVGPSGYLVTSSCSAHMPEAELLGIVQGLAARHRFGSRLIEVRRQARDHPVLANMPESHYLKCFVLQVD